MTSLRTRWRRAVVAAIVVSAVALVSAPAAEADHHEVDQSRCITVGAAGHYVVMCPERYGL